MNASVYSIQIPKAEATLEALGFLRELGLRWAAVTAPLKQFAFSLCSGLSERAEQLCSVNTIVFDEARGVWAGTNTDFDGFQETIRLNAEDLGAGIAVWGGGGTLEVIKKVIPNADFFSARSGESRGPLQAHPYEPHTVIWAVGRASGLTSPPHHWKPRLVLDLNYAEDSPGREYALRTGARYVSGLTMFRAQALVQRSFWSAAMKEHDLLKPKESKDEL